MNPENIKVETTLHREYSFYCALLPYDDIDSDVNETAQHREGLVEKG